MLKKNLTMLKKPKLEEAPWARVGGKIKDAFADQTNLGIAKNTITGLPKAAKKVGKAIVKTGVKAGKLGVKAGKKVANKALDMGENAFRQIEEKDKAEYEKFLRRQIIDQLKK